jgi:hypothetical protein
VSALPRRPSIQRGVVVTSTTTRSAALGLLAVVLSGCTSTSTTAPRPATGSAAAPDPGFGHVHGLDLNPGDGRVYAATHFGVFRLDPNGPHRVADRYQDTMGFTIAAPDVFLGGHPRSPSPAPRTSDSSAAPTGPRPGSRFPCAVRPTSTP